MAASAMDERKAIGHPVQKRAPRFHSVSLPNMISKHSNLAGLAVRQVFTKVGFLDVVPKCKPRVSGGQVLITFLGWRGPHATAKSASGAWLPFNCGASSRTADCDTQLQIQAASQPTRRTAPETPPR
ncbi:hypothetical protein [Thalassococcus profundi]|uniref:hypothetical protein n=1 Tax=Thalassococcus profundi TaxID=2282382 RepID=UPI0011C07560|nr:hypothetical protein [Thalassococcus profundi]